MAFCCCGFGFGDGVGGGGDDGEVGGGVGGGGSGEFGKEEDGEEGGGEDVDLQGRLPAFGGELVVSGDDACVEEGNVEVGELAVNALGEGVDAGEAVHVEFPYLHDAGALGLAFDGLLGDLAFFEVADGEDDGGGAELDVFEGGAVADAGVGACHDDGLVCE